ncbi:helix-turn-helix domain-containing protein [Paenibacillus spongiae]|uniref:AraC family transcriptional regulator n=1 Tax=Paenibacillus spongiae TaxID=2909671 RepID=A0ABY5S849_9BACL|nr:AraC family transcriptional regulator [Paenibacillus spongiae]UVI30084.1 AraC family transcriptional regulator [Paenibacillus spongiae]
MKMNRDLTQETLYPAVRYANRLICSGGESFGPRFIHDHQFIYVERGTGEAVITGQRFDVRPGQLFYYGPGEPHWFRADDHDPFTLFGLHFKPYVRSGEEEWTAPGGLMIEPASNLTDLHDVPAGQPRLPGVAACLETGGWPRALFQESVAEFRKNDSFSPLILRGILLQLLGRTSRTLSGGGQSDDPRLLHITFIKGKLDELAREAYDPGWLEAWSPYGHDYASRLFRRIYGDSPHGYHLARKLEASKAMLQESDRSVTAIAASLHFNSVHYFSRLFKSRFGENPSDYRNRYRWL